MLRSHWRSSLSGFRLLFKWELFYDIFSLNNLWHKDQIIHLHLFQLHLHCQLSFIHLEENTCCKASYCCGILSDLIDHFEWDNLISGTYSKLLMAPGIMMEKWDQYNNHCEMLGNLQTHWWQSLVPRVHWTCTYRVNRGYPAKRALSAMRKDTLEMRVTFG